MPLSRTSYRRSMALLLGLLAFGATGCAETVVHQQGGSRNTVRQTDGSAPTRSTVVRTPSGQKITTRTGNSTDVTIQETGPSGASSIESTRASRAATAPGATRGADCPPVLPNGKLPAGASARGCDWSQLDSVDDMEAVARKRVRPVPSVDELENRANSRIRADRLDGDPVVPRARRPVLPD